MIKEVLKAEKLESALVYMDDKESLKPFGVKPVNPEKPDKIKGLIDKIQGNLNAKKKVFLKGWKGHGSPINLSDVRLIRAA